MIRWCFLILAALTSGACLSADQPRSPATVTELFADFDPRNEPLDIQVIRQWEQDDIVYRYVTFHIAKFKGQPAIMAGFYGFPKNVKQTAGLLHIHGGGQRAFLNEVEFYAKKGYACLSINWGGREMENANEGDPNTDWGAVDPTQQNVPGYFNLQPGPKYLDPIESPRNNNWYLLTLGARRGLTFLEQQPEVDPDKLGVYGHSMGGNLTVYVAGSDDRVKVAAPSVGGSGFRTQPWPLLPEQHKQVPNGDLDRFNATLGFESYAPLVKTPLLWLGSTNDFHGIMDDTYRTGELIPHKNVRYAFTSHMNHRFTPEFAVTRSLWIDQFLKGNFSFPNTPASKLLLSTTNGVPVFELLPDRSMSIERVQIFYSIDPDPQARFWRTAMATESDKVWSAPLPILDINQPLFAFANVHYRLEQPEAVPFSPPTNEFAISSLLHTATPADLRLADSKATDTVDALIDDFTNRWQDWYMLSQDNPHHWEFSTRKISDPKWRGAAGQQLNLEVQVDIPNELVVVMTENFFRSYRGKSREFLAVVNLSGDTDFQAVTLAPDDFKTIDNETLSSWKDVDLLSFRAYYEKDKTLIGSKQWKGKQPMFRKLQWTEPKG
jgi:dienelactone hydrolase